MRKDEFPIVDKFVKNSINEVLDKIKEEISKQSRMHMDGDLYIKVSECMKIIDNHSEGGV